MNRLLVCVDGSQYGISCSRYAAWIASCIDIEIEVVYVTDLRQFEVPFVADLSGSLGLQPFQAVIGQLQELEKKKAEVTLGQAAKLIEENGYIRSIKKTHKMGFLVDSLKELEAHMFLLGKRGENANFATEQLGSTMERVARAATKPCFVASRDFKPIKRALISYDDSESCLKAVQFVKSSAIFKGIEVHVVTVSPNEREEDRLKCLQSAESELQGSVESLNCQMLHGETAPQVVEYVQDQEIDLLLMGAHGHNRIRRLIIGSSTTEMLRGCQVPSILFR